MSEVVFINFIGRDGMYGATLLDHELSRRFGPQLVFFDGRSIPAGADYAATLREKVRQSRIVLAVIGPDWLTAVDGHRRTIQDPDNWTRRELVTAFEVGARVIPVLTDRAEPPRDKDLPYDISRLSRCQALRLRGRERDTDLRRIVDALVDADPELAAVGKKEGTGTVPVQHSARVAVVMTTALVAVFGGAVVVVAESAGGAGYWIAGGAVLLLTILALAGKALRPGESPSVDQIGEEVRKLRQSVLQQWKDEVEHRISLYPLQIPFSATTEVTGPVKVTDAAEPAVRVLTVQVMDAWPAILREPNPQQPRMDGTFDSILGVFGAGRLPQRLIVLGEPGSGKSVLAQSLVVRLLARPVEAEAVPVLLPLATWDPDVPLLDWAATQIARTYPWLGAEVRGRGGVRRSLASRLLDRGRVLMVLDGLDEIAEANRLTAFRKLSVAAHGNQAMIVTCRTVEYAQIVHDAGRPMPRTPVIGLRALPLRDVRAYLSAASQRPGSGVGRLAEHVAANPHSPLADALRSPLALWLATTVYQEHDDDPADLAGHSQEDIVRHLLDGLVSAVYSTPVHDYPAVDEPEVDIVRRQLTTVASYLGPDLHAQNIDWWRLPTRIPGLVLGGVMGTLTGCALGLAVGLAVATRFSERVGVVLGIVFAAVTIAAMVVDTVSGLVPTGSDPTGAELHPRTLDLRLRWDYWRLLGCLMVGVVAGLTTGYADANHGGPAAALLSAAVIGPLCAVSAIRVFGLAPGIRTGISAAVAFGLSSWLSTGTGQPVLSGALTGVIFTTSVWVFVGLFQPAKDKLAVTPKVLLDSDRVGGLTVACTAGIAFGVLYGVALGPLVGAVVGVALVVATVVTVSVWFQFTVARVWLALTGRMPLRIMAFLAEAHARGVLRQVGGSYQFRHTELKEALLHIQTQTPDSSSPRGDKEVHAPEG